MGKRGDAANELKQMNAEQRKAAIDELFVFLKALNKNLANTEVQEYGTMLSNAQVLVEGSSFKNGKVRVKVSDLAGDTVFVNCTKKGETGNVKHSNPVSVSFEKGSYEVVGRDEQGRPAEIAVDGMALDNKQAALKGITQGVKNNIAVNTSVPSDLARVKIYYTDENPESENFEVCAFSKPEGEQNKDPNLSKAQQDISGCDGSLQEIIDEYDGEHGADAYYEKNKESLGYLYEIMTAAKEGRLMVSAPGEAVSDSHPITFEKGAVFIHPDEAHRDMDEAYYEPLKTALRSSDRYKGDGGEKYTEELRHFHERSFAAAELEKGFILDMSRLEGAEKEAFARGLTREQFVNEMLTIKTEKGREYLDAYNAYARENGLSELKGFSKAEQEKRKALSDKAYRAFLEVEYEKRLVPEQMNQSFKEGVYSRAEYKELSDNKRDYLIFMMELDVSPTAYSHNVNTLGNLLGKGVSDDAEMKEARLFAQAPVMNGIFAHLDKLDYNALLHLSDEELVRRWPEIGKDLYKLHLLPEAMKDINRDNPDHRFLDEKLYNAVNRKYTEYGNLSEMLLSRISLIADPGYSIFPAEKADVDATGEAASKNGAEFSGLAKNLASMVSTRNQVPADIIRSEVNDSLGISPSGPVLLYDGSGKKLGNDDVYDALTRGKPVFAGSKIDTQHIHAFVFDKASGRPVMDDSRLNPQVSDAVRAKLTADAETYHVEILDSSLDFLGDGKFHKRYDNLFHGPGASNDDLREHAALAAERDLMSKNEFFKAIGYKGAIPSDEEILKRKLLGVKMHKIAFTYSENRLRFEKGISEVQSKLPNELHGWERIVSAVLCYSDGPDMEENIKKSNNILDRFIKGDAKERKDIILNRVEDYKKTAEELMKQPLTTENVIKNYRITQSLRSAIGMEWEKFAEGMETNLGVDLGKETRNEIEAFARRLNSYCETASLKCNRMMSPFYRYMENPDETVIETALHSKNKLIKKWGSSQMVINASRKDTLGNGLLAEAVGSKFGDIAFVSDGENTYSAKDSVDYGYLAESGRNLFFVSKENEVLCFKPENTEPPLNLKKVPLKEDTQKNIKDLIDQGIAAPGKLEKLMLQAKIDWLTASDQGVKAEAEIEESWLKMLAVSAVEKAYENRKGNPNYDEEDRKAFLEAASSPESIHQAAEDLRANNEIRNAAAAMMPKDADSLLQMSSNEMFEGLLSAEKALNKAAEEKKPEAEIKAAEVRENKKKAVKA